LPTSESRSGSKVMRSVSTDALAAMAAATISLCTRRLSRLAAISQSWCWLSQTIAEQEEEADGVRDEDATRQRGREEPAEAGVPEPLPGKRQLVFQRRKLIEPLDERFGRPLPGVDPRLFTGVQRHVAVDELKSL